MKPMFPFYGSKWRVARRYPAPKYETVIEPFAGSAGYSTFYEPRRVVLYDADPILVSVWDYLIRVPALEVLRLPDLEHGQSVDDLRLPQEARWLIGFWLNRGSATPKKTRTAFSSRTDRSQLVWGAKARNRIASQVNLIRGWRVAYGSYESAPLSAATWFVDPPYTVKGRYYRMHRVDYDRLGAWCLRLPGQIIACEQEGAAWLPFQFLAGTKGTRGRSAEAVFLRDC